MMLILVLALLGAVIFNTALEWAILQWKLRQYTRDCDRNHDWNKPRDPYGYR